MSKYNPHKLQKDTFNQLPLVPDESPHAPLVDNARKNIHKDEIAIADESDGSEEDNEE